MNRAILLAGLCLSLTACGPRSRPVPRYDDLNGKMAALASLSPWTDGSPDRSHDHGGDGQVGSDRHLFLSWLTRYEEHEANDQYRRNYQPFPVPATIGEAIDAERQFEKEEAAKHPQPIVERDPRTGWEKLPEPTLGMVAHDPAPSPTPSPSSSDGSWQPYADQRIAVRDDKGRSLCCLTIGDLARAYVKQGYDMHADIEGDNLVMYAGKDRGSDQELVIRVVLEGEPAVGDGWHILRMEGNGEMMAERSAPWPESPDERMMSKFRLHQ